MTEKIAEGYSSLLMPHNAGRLALRGRTSYLHNFVGNHFLSFAGIVEVGKMGGFHS